jgi:hypothetical protein
MSTAAVFSILRRRYPGLVRLDFKFREYAAPDQRRRVIAEVKKLGAKRVEAMFPDQDDAELASLYKAEGIPDGQSKQVISKLCRHAEVEFAERSPEHKLIR